MKKIGYTVKQGIEEYQQLTMGENCDKVIVLRDDQDAYHHFDQCLTNYGAEQLVIINLESLGLQFSQLAPILGRIIEEGVDLHFVEKPLSTDKAFIDLLYQLAVLEKETISQRTLKGLRIAHANGAVSGRPKIKADTVEKIKDLHIHQRKSIRDIAAECKVSLGTVHKYIKLHELDVLQKERIDERR